MSGPTEDRIEVRACEATEGMDRYMEAARSDMRKRGVAGCLPAGTSAVGSWFKNDAVRG